MTQRRYRAEGPQAEFEPGSRGRVLRNRLGVRRVREIQQAESDALLEVQEWAIDHFSASHRFTSNDVALLHRRWLGHIYAWAGEYRQVNISKDGFMFAAAAQCRRARRRPVRKTDPMPRLPSKTATAHVGKTPKAIGSTQSLSAFVKSICDVMRRSNCASALQYVPELTWILFLRILDAQEVRDQEKAEAVGARFTPALRAPYRWQDWAAPWSDKPGHPMTPEGKPFGWKRQELFAAGDGKLFDFINKALLPHLQSLDVDPRTNLPMPGATPKQRIIGRTMTAVERVRVDSETNLRDILDKVHDIHIDHDDDQHFFTLSQVYEDLLLKMGEKNSDGGQFFTPREVIRAMVHTVNPELGQSVYDPCCGTGGFLAIAYEHINRKLGAQALSTDIDIDTLEHDTFFGREKENLVFPIALANLVLHGIDQPNLWHGNSLTRRARPAPPKCSSCRTSWRNWHPAAPVPSCWTKACCSAPTRAPSSRGVRRRRRRPSQRSMRWRRRSTKKTRLHVIWKRRQRPSTRLSSTSRRSTPTQWHKSTNARQRKSSSIQDQGRIVAESLARLNALIQSAANAEGAA